MGILSLSFSIFGCTDAKLSPAGIPAESVTASFKVVDAPRIEFNVAGAPTVEFNVPDMMCPEGCGEKTKEILSSLPGAKEVVINFDAKTAIVAFEEGKFDPAAAVAALKDYGFENSALNSNSDNQPITNDAAEEPAR
jgi:copper chaperone CopZ